MIIYTYPYFLHSAAGRSLPLEHLERELVLVAGACASYLIDASFDKEEGVDAIAAAKDLDMDNPFLKLIIDRITSPLLPTAPPALSLSQGITPNNSASSSSSASASSPSSPSSSSVPSTALPAAQSTKQLPVPPSGNDWVKLIATPAEQAQFLLDFVGSITQEEQERIKREAEAKAEEEAAEKEEEEEGKGKKKKDAKAKKGKGKKEEKKEGRAPRSRRESTNEDPKEVAASSSEKVEAENEKKPEEPQMEPGNGLGRVLSTYLGKIHVEEKPKVVVKEDGNEDKLEDKPVEQEEKKDSQEEKEEKKDNQKRNKGKAKKSKKKTPYPKKKKKYESSDEESNSSEGESEHSESESQSEDDEEKPEKEKGPEFWDDPEGTDFGLFDMFDDNEEKLAKSKLSKLTGEGEGLQAMRTTFAAVLYLNQFYFYY